MDYKPGERFRVFTKKPGGKWRSQELEFVSESPYSIKFTNGKYPITINKYEIKTKTAKIERIESEGNNMAISKETNEAKNVKTDGNTENQNKKAVKNTDKPIPRVMPKGVVLQPMELKGKLMDYKMYENGNGFTMKRPNGTTVMPIEFSEVKGLIEELQAIIKVGEAQ